MDILLNQYEILTKISGYLDTISLHQFKQLNQQTFYGVKQLELNNWDKTLITIKNLQNEDVVGGDLVLFEARGILVQVTFNKQKQLISLIMTSIEFSTIRKTLPVRFINNDTNQFAIKTNKSLSNFSRCFQLIIIPTLLTTSHSPEYWLMGDSFIYRSKMCTSFIRLTDLLKPTMYIIANDQRNFGKELDFLMFDFQNRHLYNHIEINDYGRNYNISHNGTSYWYLGFNHTYIYVPGLKGQLYTAINEFILTILDDKWIVYQSTSEIKCLNFFTNETFLFSQKFDMCLINEIYDNWVHFGSPIVIAIDNGKILFLTSKSRLLLFDINKCISKVLRTNVNKVYNVGKEIIKILLNNSSMMETIDLSLQSL